LSGVSRTALARAVAVAIVRYRGEHDLSQRELAERLGMKSPRWLAPARTTDP
jgi:transcriptional regulator with XRE-family HTH domain